MILSSSSAPPAPLWAPSRATSGKAAHDLGAGDQAAVERSGIDGKLVEHVYFGNCLMAGQGQAPARQALLKAGCRFHRRRDAVEMCGSAMQATIFAHDQLVAGSADVVIAGGMESMTNAPYLIPKARGGYRIGHGMMFDHMMYDGLEDAYSRNEKTGEGRSMGTFAEECSAKYAFTREAQDNFAIESVKRAQVATNEGYFNWEIAPVTVTSRAGDTVIDKDEGPLKAKIEKIPTLRAAFKKDGTITAASSSSINDGAAAGADARIDRQGAGPDPIARHGHATFAQEPNWFTTAPVGAIEKLYKKTGWTSKDVDLFEINEAFAAVPMAAMRDLDIPHEKVNIHGGACALGHLSAPPARASSSPCWAR
jgi:acetyl-CoA C-acetyltransferase